MHGTIRRPRKAGRTGGAVPKGKRSPSRAAKKTRGAFERECALAHFHDEIRHAVKTGVSARALETRFQTETLARLRADDKPRADQERRLGQEQHRLGAMDDLPALMVRTESADQILRTFKAHVGVIAKDAQEVTREFEYERKQRGLEGAFIFPNRMKTLFIGTGMVGGEGLFLAEMTLANGTVGNKTEAYISGFIIAAATISWSMLTGFVAGRLIDASPNMRPKSIDVLKWNRMGRLLMPGFLGVGLAMLLVIAQYRSGETRGLDILTLPIAPFLSYDTFLGTIITMVGMALAYWKGKTGIEPVEPRMGDFYRQTVKKPLSEVAKLKRKALRNLKKLRKATIKDFIATKQAVTAEAEQHNARIRRYQDMRSAQLDRIARAQEKARRDWQAISRHYNEVLGPDHCDPQRPNLQAFEKIEVEDPVFQSPSISAALEKIGSAHADFLKRCDDAANEVTSIASAYEIGTKLKTFSKDCDNHSGWLRPCLPGGTNDA